MESILEPQMSSNENYHKEDEGNVELESDHFGYVLVCFVFQFVIICWRLFVL